MTQTPPIQSLSDVHQYVLEQCHLNFGVKEMDNLEMMAEVPTTKDSKHFEAAIEEIFTQLAVADIQIASDQAEIDRLKTETRSILAELQAALSVN
jgi:hypothetical protein